MTAKFDHSQTTRALEQITDAGAFERLATSVLRKANPLLYANLAHPGMNPDGSTVKSPVDGIAFVFGKSPPHMIAAHHGKGPAAGLRKKWLHDPSKVKAQGSKPTAPAGDVLKTMEIVKNERQRNPELSVTLALTTNREPPEDLIRDVNKAAADYGITIDIWSGSRIADYLDNDPEGEWLRKRFFGIAEQRLSKSLLRTLSEESIKAFPLKVSNESLVDRSLDRALIESFPVPMGFLAGESGVGKTVTCYKRLKSHIDNGGCGLVLTNEIVAAQRTLEQAIDAELRRLRPNLDAGIGGIALGLCSSHDPFMIVVEDINKSNAPAQLLEKLIGWIPSSNINSDVTSPSWRLICPVWPRMLTMVSEELKKRIDKLTISTGSFSKQEACAAIKQKALLLGKNLSTMDADKIALALGNDPLLIALYDFDAKSEPQEVIKDYINGSLQRLAQKPDNFTVSEYRTAIRAVALEMLSNRRMEPSWAEIKNWLNAQSDYLSAFRQVFQCAEIIQFNDKCGIEQIAFRHDRVRAWLLTDAIAEQLQIGSMDDSALSDPFFADVIGAALTETNVPSEAILKIQALNPLALFYALKNCRLTSHKQSTAKLTAINQWLTSPNLFDRSNNALRYAALQVLSETESQHVIELTKKFRDDSFPSMMARFRNGDVSAGVQLCCCVEPGVDAPWKDYQIEHAKLRFGSSLIQKVDEVLKQSDLSKGMRCGALRLAGHLADPSLGNSISICWSIDSNKIEYLADYLWAAAECCGDNHKQLLEAVCDVWAQLPINSVEDDSFSPRDNLAADNISWAFNKALPETALHYFIERANSEDLRWPITCMLRGVDHPDAVAFIAQELAALSRIREEADFFSPFFSHAKSNWKRKQRGTGKGMSSASRQKLQQLWLSTENDKYLRIQAFELWAATLESDDLKLLNAIDTNEPLANKILRARLERGDQSAIPAFIEKLQDDEWGNWWQLGKHIWADELTVELDVALQKRGAEVPLEWYSGHKLDFIIAGLFPTLNASTAEQLLIKHWKHLRFTGKYVQNALYIASPTSIELAEEAISSCPEPRKLLEHLHFQLGIKVFDHPGVNNIRQFEVLIPYLDYLNSMDIHFIWEHCNDRGWFEFRRTYLDSRLEERWRKETLIDKTDFFEKLDVIIQKSDAYWRIEHLIDKYLKQGEQVAQIFELLREWLNRHRTIVALEVVAAAIIHSGERSDINILNIDRIEPSDQAEAIRKDTCFAVYLRSLS
ncbi:MAG: hypothetical protein M0R41_05830 [Methylobacter tundripaludum]|nr:hypothetical protein [Methylobacter tundripaludum]